MKKRPVEATAYNEKWLDSAWGEHANEAFLSQEINNPRPRVLRALELDNVQPGQVVLDIACGRGEVPALLAEKGALAIGIDFSVTSLDFATKVKISRRENLNTGSMELIQADACFLPFKDESFDRITMLDIIEHLLPKQLESMFSEVARLLKPGGFAVIHTLPNSWVYNVTFPIIHKFWRKIPADPRGEIDRELHINEQDLPRLHHVLKQFGLNHRLWLEQHMPAQSRRNSFGDQYGDNRDQFYPILTGPFGRALELISLTPAKFFLCNDIFGLLWNGCRPRAAKPKLGISENLIMRLPARKKPKQNR